MSVNNNSPERIYYYQGDALLKAAAHQKLTTAIAPQFSPQASGPIDQPIVAELQELRDELQKTAQQTISFFTNFWGEPAAVAPEEKVQNTARLGDHLKMLQRDAVRIQEVQVHIEAEVEQIIVEMKNEPNEYKTATAHDLLNQKKREYLVTYKDYLLNLKEQTTLLKQMKGAEGHEATITQGLKEIDTMFQTITQEIDQEAKAPTFQQALQEFAGNALETAKAFVEETFSLDASQLLEQLLGTEKLNTESAEKATGIIAKIKAGKEEPTDDEFLFLYQEMKQNLQKQKTLEGKKEDLQVSLKNFILEKIQEHPKSARVIVGILAVSMGTLVGGPIGGFALKTAAGKIMEQMAPDSAPETQAQAIASGIVEATGTFLLGGSTAGLVSGGTTVFQQVAPEHVQDAAAAASMAYVANQAGFSFFTSIGLGALSLGMLKNLKVTKAIVKDIKHAWSVCRHEPLNVPLKFCNFVKNEAMTNLNGIVTSIKEGKTTEAMSRIATITFCGLGVLFSLAALPLLPVAFYLLNKIYAVKFQGAVAMENKDFRAYILQSYKDSPTKGLDRLVTLLKEEEAEGNFTPFIEELTKLNAAA